MVGTNSLYTRKYLYAKASRLVDDERDKLQSQHLFMSSVSAVVGLVMKIELTLTPSVGIQATFQNISG